MYLLKNSNFLTLRAIHESFVNFKKRVIQKPQYENLSHPTHIVAVMGIVHNYNGEILLIKSPLRGWEPPGGQVEEGEDLIAALKREIFEESGIEVSVGELLAVYSNVGSASTSKTKIMMTFRCKVTGGSIQGSSESLEVGWFQQEEAVELVVHKTQNLKLKDGLKGEGIIYRVYTTKPFEMMICKKI